MNRIEQLVKTTVPASERVLVALSGGADSIALLVAVASAGYQCRAIHCNYHLRGDESMRDEAHARSVAGRLGVPLDVVDCDVEKFRTAHPGRSVEMACRELRYAAFAEACKRYEMDVVAVAHHSEDNVETMFLNLLRGTGIKGLTGMEQRRDRIVRPLLDATRDEIERYLSSRGFDWVVDSTNLQSRFRRNALRNEILPLIRNHFPDADKGISVTLAALNHQQQLLDDFITRAIAMYVTDGAIDVAAIVNAEPHPAALLYEIIARVDQKPLAWNEVEKIVDNCSVSGGYYGGRRLERGILRPQTYSTESAVITVDIDRLPACFECEIIEPASFKPRRDDSMAYFDYDSLKAGGLITLRTSRRGDRLEPYGMKGSKLVSDLMKDAHIPMSVRRSTPLLLQGEKILWVPGVRAGRHHSVTPSTSRVLAITYKKA